MSKYPLKSETIIISGTLNIRMGQTFAEISLGFSTPMKSGVYLIRNKKNGRIYVGKSSDLLRRKNQHFLKLADLSHKSTAMVQDLLEESEGDWIDNPTPMKSVEDLFEFEVIVYCYPSQTTFYENYIIKAVHPYYNIKKVNDGK